MRIYILKAKENSKIDEDSMLIDVDDLQSDGIRTLRELACIQDILDLRAAFQYDVQQVAKKYDDAILSRLSSLIDIVLEGEKDRSE